LLCFAPCTLPFPSLSPSPWLALTGSGARALPPCTADGTAAALAPRAQPIPRRARSRNLCPPLRPRAAPAPMAAAEPVPGRPCGLRSLRPCPPQACPPLIPAASQRGRHCRPTKRPSAVSVRPRSSHRHAHYRRPGPCLPERETPVPERQPVPGAAGLAIGCRPRRANARSPAAPAARVHAPPAPRANRADPDVTATPPKTFEHRHGGKVTVISPRRVGGGRAMGKGSKCVRVCVQGAPPADVVRAYGDWWMAEHTTGATRVCDRACRSVRSRTRGSFNQRIIFAIC